MTVKIEAPVPEGQEPDPDYDWTDESELAEQRIAYPFAEQPPVKPLEDPGSEFEVFPADPEFASFFPIPKPDQ